MTYVVTHDDSDDYVQNKRIKKIFITPKLNVKYNNTRLYF